MDEEVSEAAGHLLQLAITDNEGDMGALLKGK